MVVDTSSPPDNPHPLSFDPSALPPDPPLSVPSTLAGPRPEPWLLPPSHTPLIFPVFLLYPSHHQSDLITHFHESASFDDQLAVMFPSSSSATEPPWAAWDQQREYFASNLAVYVETAARRLLKVGKELTLREVLAKASTAAKDGRGRDGAVLRDGLLSFVVLVKGEKEKEWIDEFKRKRDRATP